ncbi:MAG: hypothetical protein HZA90_10595 [Verrucomicrobia bacterium]|nr:hypothetical protein [Verrucomicrobiota bacterium]
MNPPTNLIHATCPQCKSPAEIQVRVYISITCEPDAKQRLLDGEVNTHRCAQCNSIGVVAIPMVYNDPAHGLCVFVCYEDGASLIDEFHAFLETIRLHISADEYSDILERPFQIVIGLQHLARIIAALDAGVFCYRMTPGISEASQLDDHFFLIVAKYYRITKHHAAAYAAVKLAYDFNYRDPSFMRELAAYAFSAGDLDGAEAFLEVAEERGRLLRHVWEQIVVPEGMVTKIPDEIALKKLSERITPEYKKLRPECCLSDEVLAEVAGTLIGLYQRALSELGDQWELKFYDEHLHHRVQQFLTNAKDERNRLERIVVDAKQRTLSQ